ncbi:hypothetical protein H1C71_015290 [Ictidomys tridecemlineatus]|nr:hypothetical protein H1C71_015290 [Ictidomys tridecemlineatus]
MAWPPWLWPDPSSSLPASLLHAVSMGLFPAPAACLSVIPGIKPLLPGLLLAPWDSPSTLSFSSSSAVWRSGTVTSDRWPGVQKVLRRPRDVPDGLHSAPHSRTSPSSEHDRLQRNWYGYSLATDYRDHLVTTTQVQHCQLPGVPPRTPPQIQMPLLPESTRTPTW